ncbi:MAG TPA: DUF123 domain-containing protein, partial [Candidatus Lokiarchaeia archaeon]|nr:DUF123 domain-containing protein [Candidatus Lokiarchaeia archaeon]
MATGTYLLLIHVGQDLCAPVGSLGLMNFAPGWYTYVGSAMGSTSTSLFHRLRRHFAPLTAKKVRWHVDYLLALPESTLGGAIVI